MTKEQIEAQFEANQKDLTLSDTWVQWCGNYAVLRREPNDPSAGDLAMFTVNDDVVFKVKRFCAKAHYRCSRIQNGRIMI